MTKINYDFFVTNNLVKKNTFHFATQHYHDVTKYFRLSLLYKNLTRYSIRLYVVPDKKYILIRYDFHINIMYKSQVKWIDEISLLQIIVYRYGVYKKSKLYDVCLLGMWSDDFADKRVQKSTIWKHFKRISGEEPYSNSRICHINEIYLRFFYKITDERRRRPTHHFTS